MTHFLEKLISIIFPSQCFSCKQGGDSICKQCLIHIQKPLSSPVNFCTSLYSFKDPTIKKIIHTSKYFHRKDLLIALAHALGEEISKDETFTNYTLIPIPMPTMRKYLRGYNHTEVLVDELARYTGLPKDTSILTRTYETKRQVATTRKSERLRNQKNSFIVRGTVQGMNILLIDDVTTTGATLVEARKVLLTAGAHSVKAYTIAH